MLGTLMLLLSLEDSFGVTWGNAAAGGDSSQVREQLVQVQQMRGTWGLLLP